MVALFGGASSKAAQIPPPIRERQACLSAISSRPKSGGWDRCLCLCLWSRRGRRPRRTKRPRAAAAATGRSSTPPVVFRLLLSSVAQEHVVPCRVAPEWVLLIPPRRSLGVVDVQAASEPGVAGPVLLAHLMLGGNRWASTRASTPTSSAVLLACATATACDFHCRMYHCLLCLSRSTARMGYQSTRHRP